MKKVRVIVAGSRDFEDYMLLKECCEEFISENKLDEEEIEIVSGTARGADRLGERFAKEKGYGLMKFPADWDKYKGGAGHRRNAEMAGYATHCIVFWDGESTGTKGMIDVADKKGLRVHVVQYSYDE